MLVHRKIVQCGGLAAILCFEALGGSLFAQTGAPSSSPSAGASPTPAVQTASSAPTPTFEERLAGLEAYLTNSDPNSHSNIGERRESNLGDSSLTTQDWSAGSA